MKPTVGRIVHFYEQGQGPFAAIITVVHSETCCTLSVFKPQQTQVYVGSSVQHESVADKSWVYWAWPPRE